jgi:hypothetical protein
MTNDDMRPVGDDMRLVGDEPDPESLAAVQRALGSLEFLRPDAATTAEPMPDWAWARITAALATESGATAPPRRSRLTRWAGGLVAASVAVVAVGLAVTSFQGSGGSDAVVAGAAPEADARAFAEAAPGPLSFAGMVPPVLRLVDSDTEYTRSGLEGQVEQVMDSVGLAPQDMTSADLVQAPTEVVMPTAPGPAFWTSAERLRDCVTKLTEVQESTALMVDVATYEGQAASVVVAPEYPAGPEPVMSELEVWVIDPECEEPMMAMRLQVAR